MAISALDPAKKAPASVPVELLDEAALEARRCLTDEKADWADADEEGGDGGEPVSISRSEFDQCMSKGRKADERAVRKNQNWSRPNRTHGTRAAHHVHEQDSSHKESTARKDQLPSRPAGYILPHRRGRSKPTGSESPTLSPNQTVSTKPKGRMARLGPQMQKRLVIMDDEEYGL